ncbi:MAG: DUF1587 domain-containing protein, partial [Planctomycetota bacterium]
MICPTIAASVGYGGDMSENLGRIINARCINCHNDEAKQGGLDLKSLAVEGLPLDASDQVALRRWVRIHDRVRDGEMPPKEQLPDAERTEILASLRTALVSAEQKSRATVGRSTLRRLNRTEYENTLRDLLGLPELSVRDLLPEDGRVQGYDKCGPALEFSTVQIQKYLEAASKALPLAVTPYPERDELQSAR